MQSNFDVHEWNIQQIREANGFRGDFAAGKAIEFLRTKIYPKLSDADMDEFVVAMCKHFDCEPPSYRLNESEDYLKKLADDLGKKFPDLRFNIHDNGPRIDVTGPGYEEWGDKNQGKKYGEYEVFYLEAEPKERGAIVRIVKSDNIIGGKR